MSGLLILYTLFLIYGTLYPWHFQFASDRPPLEILLHSWPIDFDRWEIRDAIVNVCVYAPFGALAYLAAARRWPRVKAAAGAALGGFVLSSVLEYLQVYVPSRDPSLADIAMNTIGTAGGAAAAGLCRSRMLRLQTAKLPRRTYPSLLLLGCWIGWQFYPFLPVLGRYRLRAALENLLHYGRIGTASLCLGCAEWFAAALLLRAIFGRFRASWFAACLLLLPFRILIPERQLDWGDICGAVAAVLIWAVLPDRLRLPAGVVMIVFGVGVAELSPFHFISWPVPFSWIPFWATFSADAQPAAIVLMRKAFDYGSLVWLPILAGVPPRWTIAMAAVFLFLLEWAQRYGTGRTPEVTDAVLALLMGFVLLRLRR